jgi:hypothetical protein
MSARRLAVCNFPTPFDGEVAYFEIGLHRLTHPCPPGWDAIDVPLEQPGAEPQARSIEQVRPDAIVLHVYRDRVVDALALAASLASSLPEVPLLWCGWTAHAPYVDAVSKATVPLRHPRLVLACGEVEAVVAPLLQMIAQGLEPEALAESSAHAAWFDHAGPGWRGTGAFGQVEEVCGLQPVWHGPQPLRPRPDGAGWIEVSRGCKYACAFCVACSMRKGPVRAHLPERIEAEVLAAASHGVTMFGLLASAINYDLVPLRALARGLGQLPASARRVAGTVHAKFTEPEHLELMSQMRWETMIVGLQTTTDEAQRLMRRREQQEVFAGAVERLRALCVPEVELILGLPGDTAEGFQQSVRFALSLPVSVSIYRLRLDPWSAFLQQREALGLQADFSRSARVVSTPQMPAEELDAAEAWVRELARGRWGYRASRVMIDGRELGTRN